MRGNQGDRYDDHNRQSHYGGDRSRGHNDGGRNGERRHGRSRSRSRDRGRGRYESDSRDRNYTQHSGDDHHFNYRGAGGGGSRRDDHYSEGHKNQDWGRGEHDRHRDRDRDRGRDRDRDWDRGGGKGRGRGRQTSEPTNTVIIKGLPAHTTEPSLYMVLSNFSPQNIRLISQRGTAECKGFAFVEFFSVEYAEYFVKSFAGSMGDESAPQLIVENRAVVIDYASPRNEGDFSSSSSSSGDSFGRRGGGGGGEAAAKSDWLCETCGCQNFARRDKCYRCSAQKTASAVSLSASSTVDPYADFSIVGNTPSSTLAVRGLPLFANEDQVIEMFRQYAMVKSVNVVRDVKSNMSRGIAFVEFHSIDHATHTMNSYNSQSQHSSSSSTPQLKVNYAKENFLQSLSSLQRQEQHQQQQQQHMMLANPRQAPAPHPHRGATSGTPAASLETQNAYAQAALAAAQWSAAGATPTAPTATAITTDPSFQSRPEPSFSTPSYFETHGVSYIFQPKTGIFYDAATKFYYCPKSRLYYSEVDGRYLYAVASDKKTGKHAPLAPAGIDFLEFVPAEPTASLPSEGSSSEQKVSEDLPVARKPITMFLGGLGSKKSKVDKVKLAAATIVNTASAGETATTPATVSVPAVLPSTAKQMTQNIAKWSAVGGDADEQTTLLTAATTKEVMSNSTASTTSITTAPAPAVVCALCRRQFSSKEQLLRHERESKLHASNLAKANLASATPDATHDMSGDLPNRNTGSGQYRDRASERRAVHGQKGDDGSLVPCGTDWLCNKCKCENFAQRVTCFRCSAPISIAHGGALDSSRRNSNATMRLRQHDPGSLNASTVASGPPGLNEDTDNPGNQLLRRLGWQEGEGLGREGNGDVESVATKLEQRNVGAGSGSSSVKSGVGVSSSAVIPAVDYSARSSGGVSEYKNSILRAAKARYDQIDGPSNKKSI